MTIQKIVKSAGFVFGVAGLWSMAGASTVNVDVTEEHQVIRGFGGMVHNQWQGGQGLSEADAKLAFGTGDGQIGLNTLRIPVYANSSDFNKEVQAAKYAKKVAGDDFILYATPWTSPYAGANQHMASSNYQKYVDHLNSFNDYMKNQGVPLYAISISNEPDWCKEWACWNADEIYNFTKGYADKMRKNGVKVISTESFAYQKTLYDKVLNDANALKNWDILGAHFYASEANTGDNFFEYKLADQKGVERWMTEHYTESDGSANYWRVVMRTGDQANVNKLDTVRAMDVGYEIHRAMVVGNFNQYTWWYIKRCYGLIMAQNSNSNSSLRIPDNEVNKVSKRGYVLSQFARFVRPGAVRVGATAKPESNLFASAYKSADGDSVIVVLVNRDYGKGKEVTIKVQGADVQSFHMYTTSEVKNAEDEGEIEVKNGEVTIKMDAGNTNNKDCIVTLVGVGTPADPVPRAPFGGKVIAIPGKIEAENFDVPGTGKANKTFYDGDYDNHGYEKAKSKDDSTKVAYRESDAASVDLYANGSGIVVGYNTDGDWLEYSINVAEAGDYTLFASVSGGGNGASMQFSLDGEALTDEIGISKADAVATGDEQDAFDDYYKVKTNITLPAGEHILRMTVVKQYFDVDYFTIVKGKDATDPEPEEMFVSPRIKVSGAQNYRIFDINGGYLGMVRAAGMSELRANTASLVKRGGVYLAKSAAGKTVRLQVTK
jgi:O-glycosyl hydrolase